MMGYDFYLLMKLSTVGRPVLRKVAGAKPLWICDVWLPPHEKYSITGQEINAKEAVVDAYRKAKL